MCLVRRCWLVFCKRIENESIEKDRLYTVPVRDVEGKCVIKAEIKGSVEDCVFKVYIDSVLTHYTVATGADLVLEFSINLDNYSNIRFVANQDVVISFIIYNSSDLL